MGERSGAPVPLSGVAGLPEALGFAGRRRLGTRPRLLPEAIRSIQRCAERAAVAAGGTRARGRHSMKESMLKPRRVLMTTDTVGGVWQYSLELARGLDRCGIQTVLAAMGRPASGAQRRAAAEAGDIALVESDRKSTRL